MVLMRNIGDFDALHDARRIRRLQQNCKWDLCKRFLEVSKGIDKDYQALLLFLLNTADSEMHDTRKRGREDVIDVDEEDSDNEYDLQYEHFFGACKKSGNSYVHDSQASSSKKDNEKIYFQKVSMTQDGINGKNVLPDTDKDKVERHIFFREVSRPGSVVNEMKTGFGNNYSAKIKLENDVQARSGIKGFTIKSEDVNAAECPTFYERNGDENNQKNRSDDEHSLDVEILDSTEFFKANNVSPFVASKKIHEIMGMEDDLQHLGDPSMYSDYRKQILNVLGKPFDKEEYKNLQKLVGLANTPDLNEDLDEGSEGSCSRNKKSYLDYHPDVQRKLKANRYNRWKRLTILRGFVFWLENVTKQGAFKPWLDRECSAVEPKSH